MMRGVVHLLGILLLVAGWTPAQTGHTDEHAAGQVIRGKLEGLRDGSPVLKTDHGRLVGLEGDRETVAVLSDKRLAGRRMGLQGHFVAKDRFRVAPFHRKAFWVLEHGKKLYVSYWCSTCSIRTYTPGICMCCQRETELELREAR